MKTSVTMLITVTLAIAAVKAQVAKPQTAVSPPATNAVQQLVEDNVLPPKPVQAKLEQAKPAQKTAVQNKVEQGKNKPSVKPEVKKVTPKKTSSPPQKLLWLPAPPEYRAKTAIGRVVETAYLVGPQGKKQLAFKRGADYYPAKTKAECKLAVDQAKAIQERAEATASKGNGVKKNFVLGIGGKSSL